MIEKLKQSSWYQNMIDAYVCDEDLDIFGGCVMCLNDAYCNELIKKVYYNNFLTLLNFYKEKSSAFGCFEKMFLEDAKEAKREYENHWKYSAYGQD